MARRGGRELAKRARRCCRDRLGRLSLCADLAWHRDIRRPDPAFEHISQPAPFAGKRVLVIGYGNSGAEIALDLAEAGVDVALSVRGPVNVIPRELFGVPILFLSPAGDGFRHAWPISSTRPYRGSPSARSKSSGLKRLPRGRSSPSRRTGAFRSSTSVRSARYATDGSSFAATSQLRRRGRRFQAVARRTL